MFPHSSHTCIHNRNQRAAWTVGCSAGCKVDEYTDAICGILSGGIVLHAEPWPHHSGIADIYKHEQQRRRIMTIMMPASMLEKFMVRFLLYFVGGLVVLGIGYLVGIAEMLLTFADPDAVSLISNLTGDDHNVKSTFELAAVVGLPLLLGNAFYALGSSVWPRTSWVKTWVLQQVIGVLFLFMGAFGMFEFIPALLNALSSTDQSFGLYIALFLVLIAVAGCLPGLDSATRR